MLHLEMCLVLDNYNQEGDGYPHAKVGKGRWGLLAAPEKAF